MRPRYALTFCPSSVTSRTPTAAGGINSLYQAGLQVSAYELDVFGRLRGVSAAAAAQLLAEHPWPRLYDPDRLARNEVPVAATIYVDDVPFNDFFGYAASLFDIERGHGWCVPKAALMAAAARAAGIPARVGYADVRNHLSTERMRQTMKTDLFIWHGYTDLWIDGAWRKATPAFNFAMCQRFGQRSFQPCLVFQDSGSFLELLLLVLIHARQ